MPGGAATPGSGGRHFPDVQLEKQIFLSRNLVILAKSDFQGAAITEIGSPGSGESLRRSPSVSAWSATAHK